MGFLKNSDGKPSMMRLLCLLVVLGVVPFAYIHPDHSSGAFVLLGVALAGKWLQGDHKK